jgi:hypothetical protein
LRPNDADGPQGTCDPDGLSKLEFRAVEVATLALMISTGVQAKSSFMARDG